MFYDRAKIYLQAGKGGDGSASLRREKFVPRGGPDGGDGGRGGSVYLVVDAGLNTLIEFRHRHRFHAENGGNGARKTRHGKAGEDLQLRVPPGTVVRDADTGEILGDLTVPGGESLVVRGGRGGLGNVHFATSTHQTPRFAEKGEPGEARSVVLELKLIADVGIIGYPNVGKSTLLSAISAARPKIADYPFTTLTPNLGVVAVGDHSFVAADIPGLIEGAHRGAGLGHEFLKHIQRTRVLMHVLDGTSTDPRGDFHTVNKEMATYDPSLPDKPQVILVNKMDLPEARERWPKVKEQLASEGLPIFAISAARREGLRAPLEQVASLLHSLPSPPAAPAESPVILLKPRAQEAFTVEREGPAFRVRGSRVERLVARTDLENEEARERLDRLLARMGVTVALERAGVRPGDAVLIGEFELEWQGSYG